MKPVLYPPTETRFDSNGLGILVDATACTVTAEADGAYTLDMQYPQSGIHYSEIAMGCLILAASDPYSQPQPFRVVDITAPMHGVVKIYAEHISYDLSGITVGPFTAANAPQAMAALQAGAEQPHLFTFWTDKDTQATMTVAKPASIRSLLGGSQGSVLDTYGGDYEFDRYAVKLYNQRGADRGFTIRYGKNLIDLEQERHIRSTYTGVRPFWADMDGALVELPEKTLPAPGTFDFVRVKVLDLSQEWQDPPTVEQLRARAERYIKDNNIGVPKVSLDVKFVQLSQSAEYKHLAALERAELFDTVTVSFPALGVEATAKVIATKYDVLLDRYDTISIGDARSTLADIIVEQQRAVDRAPTTTAMEQAIKRQTELMTGNRGGYVVQRDADGDGRPDELLVMDKPTTQDAQRLWRWNLAGLAYSKSGINGPYVVGMTMDGQIVADLITTGTLDASLINVVHLSAASISTGTLALGGPGNSNARLSMLNNAGVETGYIDNTGLHFSAGKIGGWTVDSTNITNGLPYTGTKDTKATGMGTYGANWAFWAGNGRFSVNQDGYMVATEGRFEGTVYANKISVGGDAGYIVGDQIGSATIKGGNIGSGTILSGNIGSGTILGTNIAGSTVARGNLAEKYATDYEVGQLRADIASIRTVISDFTGSGSIATGLLTADSMIFDSHKVVWKGITDGSGNYVTVMALGG